MAISSGSPCISSASVAVLDAFRVHIDVMLKVMTVPPESLTLVGPFRVAAP